MMNGVSPEIKISKRIELDYGHTLPNHFGFCNQFHGHRGFVEAHCRGMVNRKDNHTSQGMLIDFKVVKQIMMEHVHDVLDHGFAVWENTPDAEIIMKRNTRYILTNEPPTAEYLAKWAYHQIVPHLPLAITLDKVVWFETPTSAASYYREQFLREVNEP